MPLLSHRMSLIIPSPTLVITARATALKAEGRDIIDMSIGEPDFDTPQFIKDAATQALKDGKTKYTAIAGTLALRTAIAQKFQRENGVTYAPDDIIVSTGAKQVLFNAFLATLDPGDEVIIPAPYWVSYPDIATFVEGTPVIIPCSEKENFKLSPAALAAAITPRTKWLVLNSPNNPTGMVYTRPELEALASVLRQHPSVYILSDDIYEHLVYDGLKCTTLAQVAPDLQPRILMVNGVSKSYAMTGWRIGYGAGPQELIKAMTIIQSQSTSNASSVSQEAARAALEGSQEFMKEWVAVYEERRDIALALLNAIPGLSCLKPHGAFYLYPTCQGLLGKITPTGTLLTADTDVATYLLDTAEVAIVPGVAFGHSPSFRLSYALHTDLVREGCQRIAHALEALR